MYKNTHGRMCILHNFCAFLITPISVLFVKKLSVLRYILSAILVTHVYLSCLFTFENTSHNDVYCCSSDAACRIVQPAISTSKFNHHAAGHHTAGHHATKLWANWPWFVLSTGVETYKTADSAELSYRKEDRAMRPIYGCPENFESPHYAPGYFSRNL